MLGVLIIILGVSIATIFHKEDNIPYIDLCIIIALSTGILAEKTRAKDPSD